MTTSPTFEGPRTPRSIPFKQGRQEFISTGFGGRPNRFTTQANLRRDMFPRSEFTSGNRTVFRPIGDTVDARIYIQGLTTVAEHLHAIATFTGPILWAGTEVAGQQLVNWMREIIHEKDKLHSQ